MSCIVVKIDDTATSDYVRRWFVPFQTLVRRSGGSTDDIARLISAGASPGVVYSRRPNGEWWSALGSRDGRFTQLPPRDGVNWYAPAALYWLRHGLLQLRLGASAKYTAQANRARFQTQFLDALLEEPLAQASFPAAFKTGKLDHAAAAVIASKEWEDWVSGEYAVCLRSFTGATCVKKEAIGAFLRKRGDSLEQPGSADFDLDLIEKLNLLILPFAPFQRPGGTPGVAIDRQLARIRLGLEEPYDFE